MSPPASLSGKQNKPPTILRYQGPYSYSPPHTKRPAKGAFVVIEFCEILFHPDCYRWYRSFTDSVPRSVDKRPLAEGVADFTASGELRPALKSRLFWLCKDIK